MSHHQFPPPPPTMTDSLSYQSSAYLPQNAYYSPPPPQLHHGPHHEVSAPTRQETTRKRPKYTRSKTGCLTCRVKKIKCDEAKPNCMRCQHGQRDCTWPEGVPARKRAASVKDSDGASNASPGMSESSSPSSTRGHSPPLRTPNELNLPPLLAPRRSDSNSYLPRLQHPSEMEPPRRDYPELEPQRREYVDLEAPRREYVELEHPRREYSRDRGRYSPPEPSPQSIALMPDMSPYAHSRYDAYTHDGHHAVHHQPRHTLAASSVRSTMGHHPSMQQWSPSPILSPEPYYHHHPERTLVHAGEQQLPRYH
ncbi:hypothetical protein FB45DRAFT_892335 [Roridomyces roridus]|uniref:Zn(2)-C6 fungal-type domain-containing protein n=1 Tax=Roridomyces roridus TaxID=1738132 RepID=A0AAD7CET6_9AGAR|nr:hypothetical protein FB45DRAFT_892335 [Roridomyces roridus]